MMTPKDLLDTMLGYLGFVVDIEETTNEGGNATLQIYTEESRRLIGRDGETLEAIQFLLNRLLQARDKDAEKVIVDCEHYRSMREDRIVQRVRELAERVRITGRSLQLEPMNSYERRLVHNAFKDDPEVATWSPSDSARIKQITLLKRRRKNSTARNDGFLAVKFFVAASLCEAQREQRHRRGVLFNHIGEDAKRVTLNSPKHMPIGAMVDDPAKPALPEFTLSRESDSSLRCERATPDGITVRKKFSLLQSNKKKDNFLLELNLDVQNTGAQPHTNG